MTDKEPVAEQPLGADDATPIPWAEARGRLEQADGYWLATARPDGRPHVRPILAVWADGALHFSTSPVARKGKNLVRGSPCVIATGGPGLDLVVEGDAVRVTDDATLRRVAEAYASKYEWPVTVRDGAFDADFAAPTAGPPPFHIYAVVPSTIFGFGTDEAFERRSTRWRF